MIEALNRRAGRIRGEAAAAMFARSADEALLETSVGLDVLRRLDAATDEAYPHRHAHIEQIALVVLRAKGFGA